MRSRRSRISMKRIALAAIVCLATSAGAQQPTTPSSFERAKKIAGETVYAGHHVTV